MRPIFPAKPTSRFSTAPATPAAWQFLCSITAQPTYDTARDWQLAFYQTAFEAAQVTVQANVAARQRASVN